MPTPNEADGIDIGEGDVMLPTKPTADFHIQPAEPRQPLPPGWTYRISYRTEKPLIGKEISPGKPVLRLHTYGSSSDTPVDQSWFKRLQPGEWLPYCMVDFYLSEVANQYFEGGDLGRFNELCLLPTNVFQSIQDTNGHWASHTRLDKWESALEHTHVAFPLNAHENHWLLGIITYASDLLQEHNPDGPIRSAMVILNSISSHNPSNLEGLVRQMINILAIGKPLRQEGVKALRFFYPSVPQQPDTVNCGLYPGHFLSVFLTNPLQFAEHCTGGQKIKGSVEEIWKASLMPTARETLKEMAGSLSVVRKASLAFHSGRTPSDLKNADM